MKYFAIIFCLILASCQKTDSFVKANPVASKIDSLKTGEDVSAYLTAYDSNFYNLEVYPITDIPGKSNLCMECDSLMAKLGATLKADKGFYKTDFDNNGYTDLLIIGGYPFIALNFGNDSLRFTYLSDFRYAILPHILSGNEEPLLRVYKTKGTEEGKNYIIDTTSVLLTGKFGYFAEYNNAPIQHKIEKIQFSAGPCYGSCPIFEMTINGDRSAWFLAKAFNFSRKNDDFPKEEGVFKGTISPEDYDTLINFINYLDFPKLKDEYFIRATDLPSAELIITYDGGKTKKISDYGLEGTHGLQSLYNILKAMRFNQKWEKATEPKNIRIEAY